MHEDAGDVTRVLVVDDNPIVRRLTCARLRAAGYAVDDAPDGQAAIEAFERVPFHVVITDVSMPRLGGLELLAALRGRERPPEVILLTGSHASDAEAAVQALRLGAHDFIPKSPTAVESIALAVERAAEKWRLRDDNARLMRELRRASLTDGLTGVGNRRAFDEALTQEAARVRRSGAGLALALVDVDHFKQVNDSHGHRAGDAALVALGVRLQGAVRGADRVFRYGGEEFAVLLPESALEGALSAGERIVQAVAGAPLIVGSLSLRITCSAGVALLEPSDDGAGVALVARADAALYATKRAGRNRALAQPQPAAAVGPNLDLEEERC